MDFLAWSDSLKDKYLSQIASELTPTVKSVLYSFGKYEASFGVPLHHFSQSQYEMSMNGWSKKSTFFSNRTRVGRYLEWLELEGIHTTIDSFHLVKYSYTQLYRAVSILFHNLDELYEAIYALYFANEQEYSSKVQEGTVLVLKMLGLSSWEVSQLQEEDILFDTAQIRCGDKIISEIPEKFLELVGRCIDLKGRYSRNMYSDNTLDFDDPVNHHYVIKQVKATEKRDAFFIGNMTKRAGAIWKKSAYEGKRSGLSKNLCHSYLFYRLHQFEQNHPFEYKTEETLLEMSDLVKRWSAVRLNSLTMRRNFFNEYKCWQAYIGRGQISYSLLIKTSCLLLLSLIVRFSYRWRSGRAV